MKTLDKHQNIEIWHECGTLVLWTVNNRKKKQYVSAFICCQIAMTIA